MLWMDGVGSKAQLLCSLQECGAAPGHLKWWEWAAPVYSISLGDVSTKCEQHCVKQWMQRAESLGAVKKVGSNPLNPAGQEVSTQKGCRFSLWGQQCSVTACIPWAAEGRG